MAFIDHHSLVIGEEKPKNNGLHKEPVQEMIGRTNWYQARFRPVLTRPSVDWTKVDYEFWSKFRRGKAKGYEIGGLFGQPIGRILTSWVLGEGFGIKVAGDVAKADDIQTEIADWLRMERKTLSAVYFDHLTLGDTYVVVNPDATISHVPPDQMTITTNPLDYRVVDQYTIDTMLDQVTIKDEYRMDGRRVTITSRARVPQQPAVIGPSVPGDITAPITQQVEYQNLIDRFPVIHFSFGKEANEIYGHPFYEALLTLFAEYDDVIRKSLDGVKMMGNPKPVIEGAEEPEGELARLSGGETEDIYLADGTLKQPYAVDFDGVDMLVLGPGASFRYAQPSPFTADAGKMLEYLFLLMLQHSGIIEGVWGGAVASSQASVSSQVEAFVRLIRSFRSDVEGAILELIKVWLLTKNLTTPIFSGDVDDLELEIEWPDLISVEESIKQAWVTFLHSQGLITDATAVGAANLVDDPQAEVDKAKEESESKQDPVDRFLQDNALQMLRSGQQPPPGNEDEEQQVPMNGKQPQEVAA